MDGSHLIGTDTQMAILLSQVAIHFGLLARNILHVNDLTKQTMLVMIPGKS